MQLEVYIKFTCNSGHNSPTPETEQTQEITVEQSQVGIACNKGKGRKLIIL